MGSGGIDTERHSFRERIQSVLDTALNPPPGSVDDDLSRDATASIHELVRKVSKPRWRHDWICVEMVGLTCRCATV